MRACSLLPLRNPSVYQAANDKQDRKRVDTSVKCARIPLYPMRISNTDTNE